MVRLTNKPGKCLILPRTSFFNVIKRSLFAWPFVLRNLAKRAVFLKSGDLKACLRFLLVTVYHALGFSAISLEFHVSSMMLQICLLCTSALSASRSFQSASESANFSFVFVESASQKPARKAFRRSRSLRYAIRAGESSLVLIWLAAVPESSAL